MLIAITAQSKDPNSEVDPRFGRAKYFHIVNTETKDIQIVDNKQSLDLPQGAGIQTAEAIINQKAEVVLTGHCGPKAFQALNAARIKVVVGVKGDIKTAVEVFLAGEYDITASPDVESHWN